jgi:hypothetical protein
MRALTKPTHTIPSRNRARTNVWVRLLQFAGWGWGQRVSTDEKETKGNLEKTKKAKMKTVTDDRRVLQDLEEVFGRLLSKWSTAP